MKPFTAREIRGTWGTMLLPIGANDQIDFSVLRRDTAALARVGLDGIYSNGSASEFYTQTDQEFDQVSAVLAEECTKAGMPFQIGICHPSAQISLERARRARAHAPAAFQVILPDWFAPGFPEVVDFLRRLAEAADPIGLVVYNPGHAKRRLLPEEWLALVDEVPLIVGAKLPGGDDAWFRAMQPVFERISVFIPGHTMASGVARGAAGSYSNVACLSPRGAARWYALTQEDRPRALELESRVLQFFQHHIIPFITRDGYTNTAVDKLLAAAGGSSCGTRLRWPYRSIPSSAVAVVRAAAERDLPEFFE